MQYRWIIEGLDRIENIDKSRKKLAKAFFDFGKLDLTAYKLLKRSSPTLAIFHLQQAAEKFAKAMLILDMNDINYSNNLKDHNFIYLIERLIKKHDKDLGNIKKLENAIFRQALTHSSQHFLNFLKSDNIKNLDIYSKHMKSTIKLNNEIAELKKRLNNATNSIKKSELNDLLDKKRREFLDSGLLTNMLKNVRPKNKILFATKAEIKKFVLRDEDDLPSSIFGPRSRKALFQFFNILFLTVITYPHEAVTRYPDLKGSIQDYTSTGIFQASNSIYGKLCEIANQLENLNPYSEIFNKQ